MRKYIFFLIFLILSLFYGVNTFLSDEFQARADKEKLGWTCPLNIFVGEFYIMMSKYDKSLMFFERVLFRCPKTGFAEKSEFQIAYCLERIGRNQEAIHRYLAFAENHPNSERRSLAIRKAQVLGVN